MTIPLPPATLYLMGTHLPINEQVRAIQREAMRVALEAAARVCDQWTTANHVYVNGAIRCAADIRALKIDA
jgi:hypothetical protein